MMSQFLTAVATEREKRNCFFLDLVRVPVLGRSTLRVVCSMSRVI